VDFPCERADWVVVVHPLVRVVVPRTTMIPDQRQAPRIAGNIVSALVTTTPYRPSQHAIGLRYGQYFPSMHMGSLTRSGRHRRWLLISLVARQHANWLSNARFTERVHVTLSMCSPLASTFLVAS
jgi:hypothetical protein